VRSLARVPCAERGHIGTFDKLKKIHARGGWKQDVRFCLVRGHARANELDSGRPIASTDIRELLCARGHSHVVSHERACASSAKQKVPTQETDEEVLLRR